MLSSNEPPVRLLLRMAWPMIGSQVFLLIMQFADVWMLSLLGRHALAAIGPAMLLVMTASTLGTGYLTVTNTLVGQSYGANDSKCCIHWAWQGLWTAIIVGMLLLLLYPFGPSFMALLGHSLIVQQFENTYFQISLLAMVPQLAALSLGYYFLATRRPRRVLLGGVLVVTLNFLISYALIFGYFGAPKLGIAGAAWGTVIASTIHALFMATLFLLHRPGESLSPSFSFRDLKKMFRIGGPAGLQDAIEWGTLGLLLFAFIGRFGDEHLAAASVLMRCLQLALLPADGLGSALMALIANAIGAGQYDRAEILANIGLRIISSYMTLVAIGFFLVRAPLMQLFSNDPMVIQIGIKCMVCVCLFQVFDALNITFAHTLQGAGDTAWPSMVSFILSIFVLLGGGILVIKYGTVFGGSFGIWSLAALLTALQGGAFWLRWNGGKWKSIKLAPTTVTLTSAPSKGGESFSAFYTAKRRDF
jgi:multidrug resistance protein, MATE family